MTSKYKYLLLLLISVLPFTLTAQNSQTLYFMNLPQNHLLNPAMRPTNRLYIGLPGISGININIKNNFVSFSDVFTGKGTNDSIKTFLSPGGNVDKFLSKLKNGNYLQPEISVQLFGLGFNAGKNYIFFDVTERVEGNFVVPGDLFTLALKGNEGFLGKNIDLSSLRADMKVYREIGFGLSRNINGALRAGVRLKYLTGLADMSLKNNGMSIAVGDDYSHTLNADFGINMSGPVTAYMDKEGHLDSLKFDDKKITPGYVLGGSNNGFGLDLGATYSLTDRIMLSASLNDIGFIRWNRDVTNLSVNNKFVFGGFDMTDVISGNKTFDDVSSEILDSLKKSFNFRKTNHAYTTYTPMSLTLAGSYSLTRNITAGAMSCTRLTGGAIRESFTLSANLNLGNLFSTTLAYTAANGRFDNIGAGLAFRPGIFQFYFISDRIPLTWNRIETGSGENNSKSGSFILPSAWNQVNLRFGMNLVFGNRVKHKVDKPMIETD